MGKPRGPDQAAIRAAVPLSKLPTRGVDPLDSCNICGRPSDSLRTWREGDEWDRPVAGDDALVFIGNDHPACIKAMERHPRLYAEVAGKPGAWPSLCGPCELRNGFACSHPDLKANGGAGLEVQLTNMTPAIMCGPGGCRTPLPRAVSCAGQVIKGGERG